MKTDNNRSNLGGGMKLLIIPAILAAGAIMFYVLTFKHLPLNETPEAWGTFGDFFGGLLNPVVSALTLFVAIRVWQLQRKELEETKNVLNEQAQTARQERSEKRFFDLLHLHHRTLEALSFADNKGAAALEAFLRSKPSWLKQLLKTGVCHYESKFDGHSKSKDFYQYNAAKSTLATLPELKEEWSKMISKDFLFPYYRMVYRLLSDAPTLLGQEECHRYIKLFRAQLSDAELTLIGLNLLLSDAGKNLSGAAEAFGLLKHLQRGPFRDLLEKELNKLTFGRRFAEAHPFPNMATD